MSESWQKLLYLLAFVGFILIVASPFAESADNYLGYVGIILFGFVTVVSSYWWWKRQSRTHTEEHSSKLKSLVNHLLRSSWPF
jgi:hypothetical protein